MKIRLFVDQPCLELKKGVQVKKDTEIAYKGENVEQFLKDLKLDTILDEEGSNGINSYKSKSHISITLNEGDILLFDPSRGYYLPPYPKTTIEQAIEDITALKGVRLADEDENTEDVG